MSQRQKSHFWGRLCCHGSLSGWPCEAMYFSHFSVSHYCSLPLALTGLPSGAVYSYHPEVEEVRLLSENCHPPSLLPHISKSKTSPHKPKYQVSKAAPPLTEMGVHKTSNLFCSLLVTSLTFLNFQKWTHSTFIMRKLEIKEDDFQHLKMTH